SSLYSLCWGTGRLPACQCTSVSRVFNMMQSAGSLRLLHTSDWHLGRTLYGRRRYGEFEAFLDWLAETLRQQRVDVLLVAGDIFDTTAPSNRAQQLRSEERRVGKQTEAAQVWA